MKLHFHQIPMDSAPTTRISLVDVYGTPGSIELLYNLLAERDPVANISHKTMPTMAEHFKLWRGRPYLDWMLIRERNGAENHGGIVHGACYVSKQHEVGIQIFKRSQGKGYAKEALTLLLERHRGARLIANVNPMNEVSAKLFRGFGFRLAQYTYCLE